MNGANRVRAFGGGPLKGQRLVRFVYLDEGGISKREPWLVVAGAFVHGDDQLIPLEDHIEKLVAKHIPEKDWDGFAFHATDIFSGSKYFKDRELWPIEKRISILEDLVRIPCQLEIPIIFQCIERTVFEKRTAAANLTPHKSLVNSHAICFSLCLLEIEEKMRAVWPDEVAQLIAEDNQHVHDAIDGVHELFRHPKRIKPARKDLIELLPLQRIRNPVLHANKTQSRPLQLADACAFFIRGYLSGHPKAEQFYAPLRDWMFVLPKRDEAYAKWPAVAWPYGPLVLRNS